MDDMIERIKKLRKTLGLKQDDFAKILNISQSTVTAYETGNRQIPARVISDICSKFHVTERWLRTGEEPMYSEMFQNKELIIYFENMLSDGTSEREHEIKKRIIQLLTRMTPRQWELLADIAEMWDEGNKKGEGQD